MQHRRFNWLDWEVSALSFGAMLRYAFDHGGYTWTPHARTTRGQSEVFVGTILQEGYRDTVRLATKMTS